MIELQLQAIVSGHSADAKQREEVTKKRLEELERTMASERTAKELALDQCQALKMAMASNEEERQCLTLDLEHARKFLQSQTAARTAAEQSCSELASALEDVLSNPDAKLDFSKVVGIVQHLHERATELRPLCSSITRLCDRLSRAIASCNQCAESLSTSQSMIAKLAGQVELLELTVAEQSQKMASEAVRLQTLEEQQEAVTSENATIAAVLAATQTAKDHSLRRLAETSKELEEARTAHSHLLDDVASLRQELTLSQQRCDKLDEELEEKTLALEAAQRHRRAIEDAERKISELQSTVVAERTAKADEVKLFETNQKRLLETVAGLQAEKAALQGEVHRVKSHAEENERERKLRQELRSQQEELNKAHASLENSMEEKKALYGVLQKVRDEHTEQLQQVRDQLMKSVDANDRLVAQLRESESALRDQKARSAEEERQLEEALEELNQTQIKLAQLTEELQSRELTVENEQEDKAAHGDDHRLGDAFSLDRVGESFMEVLPAGLVRPDHATTPSESLTVHELREVSSSSVCAFC